MARFITMLPDKEIKDMEFLHNNAEDIFKAMTRAGATVAMNNAKGKAPNPKLAQCIKLTRSYRTPSDGGINTKVIITGYMPFSGNRKTFARRNRKGGKMYTTGDGVPAEFVAILYEYGRSTSSFPKHPFFRQSFSPTAIERAMKQVQKEASGGLLDE